MIDAADGTPLIGVAMVVEGTTLGTVTGVDGRFVLREIPVGAAEITANLIGFRPERRRVAVAADRAGVLAIALRATVIESSPLVVTAARRLQELRQSPTAMVVASADDIVGRNAVSVRSALDYVPGTTSVGSQVSIRGSSGFTQGAGSRVAVLLDGVSVLSGDAGDVKWAMIPPEVVERIEVAKGAGSALYGSGALGGVINHITREPGHRPETRLRLMGGWNAQLDNYVPPPGGRRYLHLVAATHTRRVGKTAFLASVRRYGSDGSRAGGDGTRHAVFLKMRRPLGRGGDIGLTGFWNYEDNGQTLQSYPDSLHYVRGGDTRITGPDQFASVVLRHVHGTRWSSRISAHAFRTAFEEKSSARGLVTSSDAVTGGLEGQLTWIAHRRLTMTAGASTLRSWVDAALFTGERVFSAAAYCQGEARLADLLSLTAGARYDRWDSDASAAEGQISPRIGVVFIPWPTTSVRGLVSKGYRGPTIGELSPYRDEGDLAIRPNAALRPERSWTMEVGMSQTLARLVAVDLTAFDSRYRDMIEPTIQDTTDPATGKLVVAFQNSVAARIRGLESAARCAVWGDRLQARVSHMLLDTRSEKPWNVRAVGADSLRLPYRPRHTLHLGVEVRVKPLFVGYDYRYVSSYPVTVYPNDPRVPQKLNDVRFGAAWGRYRVTVSINNLFNYVYAPRERRLSGPRQYAIALDATM